MPASSPTSVAAELARATDASAALGIVSRELAAQEANAGFALFIFDARRQTLSPAGPRSAPAASGTRPTPAATLALDHLPPAVQYAVLAGQRFADVGDQATQYAQLLRIEGGSDLRLSLKGLVLEGALAAVLAMFEPRRRGSSRLLERAEPLAALFELAFARFSEREARHEAVAALHEITSRLRAEHASTTAALEREVERLRAAQRAGTSDVVRGLRDAVAAAERRATAAEERLGAVERQVVSAVDRLEHAHRLLHEQEQQLRERDAQLRQLAAQLTERQLNAAGT